MTKATIKTHTPKIDTEPKNTATDRDLSKAIPKGRQSLEETSKRIAEIRARRKERGNIDGPALRLGVPEELKDPNWDYRWVNDSDMRIHNMVERDWEFAESELDVSNEDTGMGSRVERTVNERSTKGPQKGFLMKKPKEIYEEDQAAKEAKRKQLEKSMEKGQAQSAEGLQGPHSYVVPGTKLT